MGERGMEQATKPTYPTVPAAGRAAEAAFEEHEGLATADDQRR